MTEIPLIAIVDDDPSIRRALQRLVRSAGYGVETFASARDYLVWLAKGHASCLVLDVHMDGMNGFELQERLTTPVIFITAHDDGPTRARIEKSESAGHLWKPFDEQTVIAAIRRALERASGARER